MEKLNGPFRVINLGGSGKCEKLEIALTHPAHRITQMKRCNMKLQQEAINIFTKCSEIKTSNFAASSDVSRLID